MDHRQSLIEQSVAEISTRLAALDADRRRMFLDWLQSHQREATPISDETVRDYLMARFEELTDNDILREFRLILSEIAWWRDWDDGSLAEIMEAG